MKLDIRYLVILCLLLVSALNLAAQPANTQTRKVTVTLVRWPYT